MQARVKADSWIHIVTACAGTEFVQYEWRRVPAGGEAEVKAHNLLDWQEDGGPVEHAAVSPYDHMTDDELKAAAKDAGIPNYWSMGRVRLLSELEAL